jgi:hypothetical protein
MLQGTLHEQRRERGTTMDRTIFTAARPAAATLAPRRGWAGRRACRALVGLVALLLALSAAGLWAPRHSFAATGAIAVNTTNWNGNAGWGAAPFPEAELDSAGIVHLWGAVQQVPTSSGDWTLIGYVPLGMAPNRTLYTIVHTGSGTYADLLINPDREIRVIASQPCPPLCSNFAFVSLESISYYPGTGTSLAWAVNPANWSANAGWGSVAPAWVVDSQGFVHLQGAVRQTATTGGDPTLLLTLPAQLTPPSTASPACAPVTTTCSPLCTPAAAPMPTS